MFSSIFVDPSLIRIFDYAGVAVFAATGALAAARKKQDIVTFIFFGCVTGIGGGTLRDLLMSAPVFWVADPRYLTVCAVTALTVWFIGAGPAWSIRTLLWLDAIGLAAYTVLGASKAAAAGLSGAACVAMGVLTATFGGIVRDVLAGEPSVLLRREIYVTAALSGALFFIGTVEYFGAEGAGAVAFTVAFALRAGALIFGWTLPAFARRTDEGDTSIG